MVVLERNAPHGLKSAGAVWRATNQGSRLTVEGFLNATSLRSRTTRNRIGLPVATRYIQIAIPVFYPAGSNPIADALFSGSQAQITFQVGIEYPYTNAVTGLGTRIPVTFGGANYASYDNSTWDAAKGFIYSDIIDLGVTIPANTPFGRWFTFELPSASTNVIPYNINSSNFIQRYTGNIGSTSSQIIGKGGASDAALTATSVTAHTSSQSGSSDFYDPCVMRVLVPASVRSAVVYGDSITYGSGEGASGSGSYGDTRGDVNANAGIFDRGLFDLGILNVNVGKGSDGNKFIFTPANWKYRREILSWCNPTHVINGNIHNDITQTAQCGAWAASTAYVVGDAAQKAGVGSYICIQAGTSAASGGPTGTGANISDGTCRWAYFGDTAGETLRVALQLGRQCGFHSQIKAALPTIPILCRTAGPNATSTDQFATTANQTVANGSGGATSRRGLWNAKIRALYAPLQIANYLDCNPYLEDSYPTETSKWVVNGSSNYATLDGGHPNSKGHDLAKAMVTAGLFT